MSEYYSVSQYADITGKDSGNIRRMLIQGETSGRKDRESMGDPKRRRIPGRHAGKVR